ncbi:MAG: serine kinase [Rhodobacteraceae bacterium]|nr:serine kinase [Paracoccaceae bacterium]
MLTLTKSPVHGSAVSAFGRGVLILGASGSGKSGLALQLLALGAHLVADDQVILQASGAGVKMFAPDATARRIEARFLGLIPVPAPPGCLSFVVDLDKAPGARLPAPAVAYVMLREYPLINGKDVPNLGASIWLCLKHGLPKRDTIL